MQITQLPRPSAGCSWPALTGGLWHFWGSGFGRLLAAHRESARWSITLHDGIASGEEPRCGPPGCGGRVIRALAPFAKVHLWMQLSFAPLPLAQRIPIESEWPPLNVPITSGWRPLERAPGANGVDLRIYGSAAEAAADTRPVGPGTRLEGRSTDGPAFPPLAWRRPGDLAQQLVAPGIQQSRADLVPAGDRRQRGVWCQALRHDRLLLLQRPTPPPLARVITSIRCGRALLRPLV